MSGIKTTSTLPDGTVDFETIAIMPVQRILPEYSNQKFVRCPLSGAFLRTCGTPVKDAESDIEELFIEGLKSMRKYVLIPPDRVEGVYKRVKSASFKESLRDELRTTGEELGADAIVAGYLFCYLERKGYTYAAEQPASAVFSFHLIRVRDGAVIWGATFDKTQGSLMGNILDIRTFFMGGGKWITVRELSAHGIKELLNSFPERE
ncbi:MAG: hypothetical protein PHU03_05840 [Syntrophales bacterium]|nr:hypothetical protein [Syntrophales bacterium]